MKLTFDREPRWLPLVGGARVKVRPGTTALIETARAAAARLMRELRKEFDNRKEAGLSSEDIPDLDDPDVFAGLGEATYGKCLARQAIIEWEGFAATDGSGPAPVTPETVGDMMDLPGFAASFRQGYESHMIMLLLEGNVSGAAPNGSSTAAPATAPAAATKASLARRAKRTRKASSARS